jgi:threonine synthase
MLYKSTRGGEWGKSFESVLISSYASDGGLYVPEYLPLIDLKTLSDWATLPFRDVCAAVVRLFTDLDIELLRDMTKRGFAAFNDGNEPTLPMTKFDDIILLDASLGPTLAFKDIGQQVMLSHPRYFAENLLNIVVFITNSQMVAQLLNYYLGERNQKAKILVDTSGDTGTLNKS